MLSIILNIVTIALIVVFYLVYGLPKKGELLTRDDTPVVLDGVERVRCEFGTRAL